MPPFLKGLPRVDNAAELLDGTPSVPDLEANLHELARLNRWFGGSWVTRSHLARLLRHRRGGPVTLLDVGSGGADVPLGLVRWLRRRGQRLRVIAVDRDRRILEVARRRAGSVGGITFIQADGLDLPVKSAAVDVATSSLTLHHLEPSLAPRFLAELARAARLGFVVNDLMRGRLIYALVWLVTRLFGRNRLTRHDGPLSVLRAYRAAEIRTLARAAGLGPIRIIRHPFCVRLAVVGGHR